MIKRKFWQELVVAVAGLYVGTTAVQLFMKPNMHIPADPIEILDEQEEQQQRRRQKQI